MNNKDIEIDNHKYDQYEIYKYDNLDFKNININSYTLKINSKNRNIQREPNPFSFEITFQSELSDKAVIQDTFENIKKIQIPQISIPRHIPRDFMGEPFTGITPLYNTNNSITLSYYAGININNSVIPIYDISGNLTNTIEVLELVDLTCKKTYLVADQYNNPYKLSKLLFKADIYSHLNINNVIYPVTNITGNVIYLDNTTNNPLPIFTNERLIIGDFYKNNIIVDSNGTQIGITTTTIQINQTNVLNYQFLFNGQYLEYQVNTDPVNIFEKKLFQVTNVTSQLININGQANISNTAVIINGIWTNGLPSNYSPTSLLSYNLGNIVRINQFNHGSRDLLDEKVFYLSLYPFVPLKNVSTDPNGNNIFGIFIPSTQSKEYLILKGDVSESYNNTNLQNTNTKLKFNLYDSNFSLIGTVYNKYINLYQPNNILINSYLQHSPDVLMIMKLDEIERSIPKPI